MFITALSCIFTAGDSLLKRTVVFQLLLLLFASHILIDSASASAVYEPSTNNIIISNEKNGVDLTWLENQVNNKNVLSHSGKTWYLNANVYLYGGSKLFINNEDCDVLVLGKNAKLQYNSPFYINNVEIRGGYEIGTNARLHDVYFNKTGGIRLDNMHEDVYNITVKGGHSGLRFYNGDGLKIHNISVTDVSKSGLELFNVHNTEVYDVYVKNAGDFRNPSTSIFGVIFDSGSSNSSMHDIFVDGTGWSSIEATGKSSDIHIYNITVYNSGHNGLDLHGCGNVLVENMSVHRSVSNNYLITGTGSPLGTYNVTLRNVRSYNATPGSAVQLGVGVKDILFENLYSEGADSIVKAFNLSGLTIINAAGSNNYDGITFTLYSGGDVINGFIIDSDLRNHTSKSMDLLYSTNSRLINVLYDNLVFYPNYDAEATVYYYADVMLLSNGKSVPEANIALTNNEGFSSPYVNGFGSDQDQFIIDKSGRTPLPAANRLQTLAIAEYYKNSQGQMTKLSHNLEVTYLGKELTLPNISPDPTWHRENPNVPTYTITAVIPDGSTGSPNIIGFAPSQNNPFAPGGSKKFRVWVDEALTDMRWYVDGSLVSSGSLEYNWNIKKGSHTIHFEGANTNGAVMQSWSVSGRAVVPEEYVGEPVVAGSGITFTPSMTSFAASISESTTFMIDPDEQFTSSQWYLNGEPVASGLTTYSHKWDASGSFTVRFEGVSDRGTVSRTWNVVVSGSEYSKVSIVPSTNVVTPDGTFSLDMYIDPKQPVTGAQFDLH
jgi:hypothetical protein